MTQIREEAYFTAGRIMVRGKMVSRRKGKFADYLLYAGGKTPIAVVEAKDNNHAVDGGLQQALGYAKLLDIPFVFSSKGDGFAFHDRTGTFDTVEDPRHGSPPPGQLLTSPSPRALAGAKEFAFGGRPLEQPSGRIGGRENGG